MQSGGSHGSHANGKIAHAHIHHPYQHTPVNIFDCHFESGFYQGASANFLPARTALEQCHIRGFVTVY